MTLDFYFDIVCPFAYMASTRIETIAAEAGATLRWHPILLGGVFRAIGSDDVPASKWAPARQRLNDLDIERSAEHLGVPLRRPKEHPRRTVDVMRLLVAAPEEKVPTLAKDLFRAYWVDGVDVSQPDAWAPIARAHGIDPAITKDDAIKKKLFAVTDAAVAREVFGVPTFFIDGDQYWGTDRLRLVRRALGLPVELVPSASTTTSTPLTFFHDVSSPFSYLASTQIERIAAEHGAVLESCPILLGALFKEIGTADIPLFQMSPPRMRWFLKDMTDWAKAWGVPFKFPSVFPIRTVDACRAILVEPRASAAIYRAAWVEDRDVSTKDGLKAVLDEAGFDGAAILARTQEQSIKDQLRANTTRAMEAGACGVPSFQIGDLLFWGQDRLDQLAHALDGWCPSVDQNGSFPRAAYSKR
jgi:2-hydroxychromene-2-carboxylate isomerase